MLKSIEGIFRNGKVELLESPPQTEESRVVITFLSSENSVGLEARGINAAQAENLRTRLRTFADDWNRPEMDVYDED